MTISGTISGTALGTASGSTVGPPAFAKVLIAGGSGAAHEKLIGTISEVTGIFSAQRTPMTFEYGRFTIDSTLRLFLSGLPTGDRYRFAWDQLSIGALGAVVIAHTPQLADAFAAIDFLESRNLPFVIALTHPESAGRPSLASVRAALDVSAEVALVEVDTNDAESIKQSLLELLDVVLLRAMAS